MKTLIGVGVLCASSLLVAGQPVPTHDQEIATQTDEPGRQTEGVPERGGLKGMSGIEDNGMKGTSDEQAGMRGMTMTSK
jgi:hypothetical protein